MKPAPCSWRGVTWRMRAAGEPAIELRRVHAGNAEDVADAVALEQRDQVFAEAHVRPRPVSRRRGAVVPGAGSRRNGRCARSPP